MQDDYFPTTIVLSVNQPLHKCMFYSSPRRLLFVQNTEEHTMPSHIPFACFYNQAEEVLFKYVFDLKEQETAIKRLFHFVILSTVISHLHSISSIVAAVFCLFFM